MKYKIIYISASGNTKKLACGLEESLPFLDTLAVDLSNQQVTGKADIYLICFGMKNGAIPFKIMDVLEDLAGKTILFFVTASIEPTEAQVREVERKLEPFMPDDCDYRGLYLCPGQVSAETLAKLRALLEQSPDNEEMKTAYDICKRTLGRPNQADIDAACDFIRAKLNII